MDRARRIYRLMLKLYPARFREEFAEPLERQFQDDYRDAQGLRAKAWFWMSALADLAFSIPAEIAGELRHDVKYALRVYRQRKGTTLLVLVAMALAIGATTGVFSVVNALLLRSLPFRQADQLVELFLPPVNSLAGREPFQAWVRRTSYLESAAGFQVADMNLVHGQGAVRVRIAETTADFFAVLGVEPRIGRAFASDEDLPARDSVTILSDALWQQMFGGDPRVLGSVVTINGTPMTVIGVAPPGVDFPGRTALWTPTAHDPERLPKTGAFTSRHIGRLKPGVILAQASLQFENEARAVHPDDFQSNNLNRPYLYSLRDRLAGTARQASMVLLGVVGFVLLIACANVAHLLLSRITERRQELAIRGALGASRARLVQQMIAECMLLTLAAAVGGLLVAYWSAWLANSVQPSQLAAQQYTILDWRVLGFALALAAATGMLFGVLPASLIGRMQPSGDLARSRAGANTSGAPRLRTALVAMQAAFTLMLLAGSVTMGRTFLQLLGARLGFQPAQAVSLSVALTGTPHEDPKLRAQYYADALDSLRAIPGVVSAGAAEYLPLTPDLFFAAGTFRTSGTHIEQQGSINTATPGYLAAMGIPLLRGRDFTPQDRMAAIVTDGFARRFGGAALVGRRMFAPFNPKALTVVGVIPDTSYRPGGGGPLQVFVPAALGMPVNLTFVVRVRGNADAYLPVCRDAIHAVDPQVPVFSAKTMEQRLSESLSAPRFYTIAVFFFGCFALLLAIIGIYGVATVSIAQRTHEIGVRLAVGASPERLRASLLQQSLLPVVAGSLAGIAGAIGLGQLVRHLIENAEPVGVYPCALAAVVLAATAAIAIWVASKRIVRLDPNQILRAD